MLDIRIQDKEVSGYAYNNANNMLTHIEWILERQLSEDSSDGMKGLASDNSNALNKYKSTINIKKRDVLAASIAAANIITTDNITAKPDITSNSDAQDESERQNVFRLAAIGVKEEIAEGITNISGKDITNPILRMTDGRDFKSVDEYHIHQLLTDITEGEERPEATNIRRQFVNFTGTISDCRETVVTNVKIMAEIAAKLQGYGVQVHSYLQSVVILSNTELAAHQKWGTEISVTHFKIMAEYRYNHIHDADSIRKVLIILATVDALRDRRKAKAPGELADMVSQGMKRL